MKKEYTARKKHGFKVEYLEDGAVAETGINAPAANLSADGAQTDAYMLTHSLHQYNLKRGLEVYDRTCIVATQHNPDAVNLVTKNGYTIKAKKLVYATGYEVTQFIDKPIVKFKSTYSTISETLSIAKPFWKKNMLLWNTANPYLYMRTTEDNRIMIGGRDEDFYSPKRRDFLITKKAKQLASDFKKKFPHINFIPEFSWTGTFGSTKDGLPYIYKKLPHSYFALGFVGNGITFSLIAAEIIAATITGQGHRDSELFKLDR